MVHDPDLLDLLCSFPQTEFRGDVFRATRRGLDALTASFSGGRWAPKGGASVLYTSLIKEGAMAELSFHLSQFNPLPSKPVNLHRISLTAKSTLRLFRANLESMGVVWEEYSTVNHFRTQEIGAAAVFLGCDGLIAPSARWSAENMMIFTENHFIDDNDLRLVETKEVAWIDWAKENGFVT